MTASTPAVTVYWRPGCGFCAALLARLEGSDIDFAKVNIWDDPDAATYVRSVARGHETVPTVKIDETVLVNPSFPQLVDHLTAVAAPDERNDG